MRQKVLLVKIHPQTFPLFLYEYTTQCFTNYSICFFTWTLRVCQSLWLDCKMLKLISGFGKVILPDYLADFKCDDLQGTDWVLIFADFKEVTLLSIYKWSLAFFASRYVAVQTRWIQSPNISRRFFAQFSSQTFE